MKLLDFGIAQMLTERRIGRADGLLTRVGQRAMTLDYAVAGTDSRRRRDHGDRCLCVSASSSTSCSAGRRAHASTSASLNDREREVLDRDVIDPSRALADGRRRGVPLSADEIAAQARTTSRSARRRLRGDLDTIVRTALHRDPARRYASVEALARDIERHLAGLPIAARPDAYDLPRRQVRRPPSHRRGGDGTRGAAASLWQRSR